VTEPGRAARGGGALGLKTGPCSLLLIRHPLVPKPCAVCFRVPCTVCLSTRPCGPEGGGKGAGGG